MALDMVFYFIPYFILLIGVLYNVIQLIHLPLAYYEFKQRKIPYEETHAWAMLTSQYPRAVSLLVPACNEELSIVDNIHSMLGLKYPDFEVIVINDGSTDNTLEQLINAFGLSSSQRSYAARLSHQPIKNFYSSPDYPGLIIVDKEKGGKSDALNAGINLARYPLFCAIDADSILEADALIHAVQPFIEEPEHMVATGGTIRIANGCTIQAGRIMHIALAETFLPLIQTIEYLRAFLIARLAWSRLGALTIISGAFGVFKRDIVLEIGGYNTDIVGEDMEIILRMHHYLTTHKIPYAMRFMSRPVCWTEVPATLRQLQNQRIRWQQGALESCFIHSSMLFKPAYGRVGMIGVPYSFIVDVINPPLEMLGYILIPILLALGILNVSFAMAYVFLVFGIGAFVSVACLIMEELETKRFPHSHDLAVLTIAAIIENFGYRQINTLWKLAGYLRFIKSKKGHQPHCW